MNFLPKRREHEPTSRAGAACFIGYPSESVAVNNYGDEFIGKVSVSRSPVWISINAQECSSDLHSNNNPSRA